MRVGVELEAPTTAPEIPQGKKVIYFVEKSYSGGGRPEQYYDDYQEAYADYQRSEYRGDYRLGRCIADDIAQFMNRKYKSEALGHYWVDCNW